MMNCKYRNTKQTENQRKELRCHECGEKLLSWELTCPECGTVVRVPEIDHINYTEKSEYPAPLYRAG